MRSEAERPVRADAARNREKLLEAAADLFGEGGPEASLEGVARRAGVGIGTLYRHFPTREALFEAVYRRDVTELAELAAALSAEPSPVDALRRWLKANVAFVARKKGMAGALQLAISPDSELTRMASERLISALEGLLGRAVAAGQVRSDIVPKDVFIALVGMCMMNREPGWRESVTKLIDVLVDGMRTSAAGP